MDAQSIAPEAIEVEVFGISAMLTPRVRTAIRDIRRNIAAVKWHFVYNDVPYRPIRSVTVLNPVLQEEENMKSIENGIKY